MQLHHVLKYCPCEIGKAKLNMAEKMLDGDILESWKLWHKAESENGKEGTFKKEVTGDVYKKKYVEGYSDGVFNIIWVRSAIDSSRSTMQEGRRHTREKFFQA